MSAQGSPKDARPVPRPPAAVPAPPRRGDPSRFGRVADDGTVYVRTAGGERNVGQYPEGTPAEALAFFSRRFDALAFEVELLEKRVRSGTLSPDEASKSVSTVRKEVTEAHAVGDLDSLLARLDALTGDIAKARDVRKAERAQQLEAAHAAKERIAAAAEKVAEGNDWRNGANIMRDLLEEWKSLPRLEKATDDALWRRFSGARTTYTRRRKAHFAELNEQREGARSVKERLVKEAEAISGSTDWGPTAGKYRDLMKRWKAAGPAPRDVEEELWQRFRAAQDAFFGARDAANAQLDAEFAANAEVKEALAAEAEKLVPVSDVRAAKEAFRAIAEKWDAAGKVPRDRMGGLEGRMRRVEQAIRAVEDQQWKRSNPEGRARAADTVAQLEAAVGDLERRRDAARRAGDEKKAAEHEAAIEGRRPLLDAARRALDEFSA